MTDPFTPASLHLVDHRPIATATSEDSLSILQGLALKMMITERVEQIEKHGRTPYHDIAHDQAELALAAKAYLDTYIDLALTPDITRKPGDLPESWPWQHDFWKEPGPADQVKALTKAIALAWAELDRILTAQALNAAFHEAAQPLYPLHQDGR